MPQTHFGVLRQILLDLGFTLRIEADHFARFDHEASNTWFVFPAFKDEQLVPLPHLVGTRRSLDERGLLPQDRFDDLIRQHLIAG